ncbi:MAG: GNAT family N-acetyltransferase [Candidatus Thiodiazotropha sp. (ex Monitilora ramsayi)]|nr:GNAT family N-acetyltransferase [Candidatus Thiodiazotropha sp. (ex Monitilora ramsayi)]
MKTNLSIQRATSDHAEVIAVMVGELLTEIMNAIGDQAFNFDLSETTARLKDFIDSENYFVFVAWGDDDQALGFVTLCESYALYAEGAFGTLPELYVRPAFRSGKIGHALLSQVRAFGVSRGWKRLEVTTPPLPEFDKTLAFYEREGFAVTGGRKLKALL